MKVRRTGVAALTALSLALSLLLAARSVHAQATQDALVLSTGASRGFAHAGVLAGLDSLGYDPDIVVGASMGAVVGALYAAGYAPADIWKVVQAIDWGDVFMASPLVLGPTRQVYAPALGLGVNLASFEVSRGFVSDWRVNRHLVHLLFDANARSRGDFDRLARRYRAVTADVSTGEEVVIASGDLARAVRISMGTPGFFAPLELDGRLLTDGGVANYLPISVARRMGASPIVAVDVSRPHPRVARTDPAAIGGRAVGLLMRNAVPDTLADVMIVPAIGADFSGAIFPQDPAPLFALGLEAAREVPRSTRTARERALPSPPDSFSALIVEAPDPVLEKLAERLFADIVPGPYDAKLVLERVDRLYATGFVTGVWPRVESRRTLLADDNGNGASSGPQTPRDVLVVRVDGVPRTSLGLAPGYDNDRGGRLWASLQQRLGDGVPLELTLAASMNGLERWGELSLRRHDVALPFSTALGLYSRQTDARTLEPDSLVGETKVWRSGAWLAAERRRVFPDWLGTLAFHGEYVNVTDGEFGLSFGPLVRVTSTVSPSQIVGLPSVIEAELRFGEVAYGAAGFKTSRAFALPGLLAAAVAEADLTTGDAPLDVRPALGDRHSMPGLSWGAERGKGRVIAGIDLARPFLMGGFLRTRMRVGSAPLAWDDLGRSNSWVGGVALEALWSLPFGPVMVGGGVNTRGHHRLDVSLGTMF